MPAEAAPLRLLVIGINYAPEQTGIGPFTSQLAQTLAQREDTVSVIAAEPYYPAWKRLGAPGRLLVPQHEAGVEVVRCPIYIPNRQGGLARLFHHVSFLLSALVPAWRVARRLRPDAVLVIAPSLLSAVVGLSIARRRRIPAWLHVQDLEVDAALAMRFVGLRWLGRAMIRLERRLLSGFDRVSAISEPMVARLRAKGVAPERLVVMGNWATIAPSEAYGPTPEPCRKRALYAGTLNAKQDLDVLVAAARLLAHRGDLTIAICGEGPERDRLEDLAQDLPNLSIGTPSPPEALPALLASADLHVLPQSAAAADLVMPSKLGNMLASGRPVVATARRDSGIAQALGEAGVCVSHGDAKGLAQAIEALAYDTPRAAAMGAIARDRARWHWDRDTIIGRFRDRLAVVVAQGPRTKPGMTRLWSGTGANLLGKLWIIAAQLVTVPVLTQRWGLDGFGLWLMLSGTVAYLAMSSLGLGSTAGVAMARHLAQGDQAAAGRLFRTTRNAIVLLSLVAGCLLVTLALPLVLSAGPQPALSNPGLVLPALLLWGGLSMQSGLIATTLRADRQYAKGTVLHDLFVPAEALVIIGVAVAGGGIAEVALALVFTRGAGLWLYARILAQLAPWTRHTAASDLRLLRPLLPPAIGALSLSAAQALSLQAMVLVVGLVAGPAAAGLFGTVRLITRLPLQFALLLHRATIPELAHALARDETERAKALVVTSLWVSTLISAAALPALLIWGPALAGLLAPQSPAPPIWLFALLGLAGLAHVAWSAASLPLVATNRLMGFAQLYLVATGLALGTVLISPDPLAAAALALLAAELVMVAWMLLRRRTFSHKATA